MKSNVVIRIFAVIAGVFALGLALMGPVQAKEGNGTRFNHITTGFRLMGAHAQIRCDSCHLRGIFTGTPKECAACHTAGSRRAESVKTPKHFPTSAPCEECHQSNVSWSVARFSHASVTPGMCESCHNGRLATGKPRDHVITSAACDICHRTSAWLPASFNHAKVTPGTCESCHNGTQAKGKPNGHFVTTRTCDACHTTSAWSPALTYAHTSPAFVRHSSGVTCAMCHTTNSETATWPFAAYKPDCAGCHANRFKPDAHKKTEVPTTIFYTVSELRNCTGSCHLYTDNTFTTILRTRSGEHRSTSGGF